MSRGRMDRLGRLVFPPGSLRAPVSAGGSSSSSSPGKVAINAPLSSGDYDGQPGELRVGTWPDQAVMRFTWNATASKWVGEAIPLVAMMDQGYLTFSNTGTYQYLAATTGGSGTPTQTGWTSRSIPHMAEIYSQGGRLQAELTGIIAGNSVDTGSVRGYFFAHDDGDTVNTIVANAPNGALGNTNAITGGIEVVTPGTSAGRMRGSGWHDVTLSAVTKKNLWCQLFAVKNAAGNAGVCQALDVEVQARVVI